MRRILPYILLLVFGCVQDVVAGEPQKNKEAIKISTTNYDDRAFKELKKLEKSLSQSPENAIKQLDVKVKYALDLNLEQSIVFAYQ